MRVATFNIRNGRAPDPSSLWWRRRRRVAEVIDAVDADVWGLQEAYRFQIAWLRQGLAADRWGLAGRGRSARGGGEHVPVWWRTERFDHVDDTTRWFGPTPDRRGSRQAGAAFPRIATLVELVDRHTGQVVRVVNTHLDERSAERRTAAAEQLVEWLTPVDRHPTIVLGDLNGAPHEPALGLLAAAGLRSALPADAGPTSNGFGARADEQSQIDYVLVTRHWRIDAAEIVTRAGFASDHFPVVADLTLA